MIKINFFFVKSAKRICKQTFKKNMYINVRTAHYKAVKEICFTLEEVTHLYECDFFLAYIFILGEKH